MRLKEYLALLEDDDDLADLGAAGQQGAIKKLQAELKNLKSNHAEIYHSKGMGVLGEVCVIQGHEDLTDLARMLGVPDGWKMTKIKPIYGAFDGERFTFFTHPLDFDPEDDDE